MLVTMKSETNKSYAEAEKMEEQLSKYTKQALQQEKQLKLYQMVKEEHQHNIKKMARAQQDLRDNLSFSKTELEKLISFIEQKEAQESGFQDAVDRLEEQASVLRREKSKLESDLAQMRQMVAHSQT